MAKANCKSPKVLSRGRIEALIAKGRTIVISDNRVLCLDGWLDEHPGGLLPVQHMVGRDATDQIAIYHDIEVTKSMERWQIGTIDEEWVDFEPPISGGKFRSSPSACDQENEDTTPAITKETMEIQKGANVKVQTKADVVRSETGQRADAAQKAEQEEIELDAAKYPSVDVQTQREITYKFRQLHRRVREEGLYMCHYINYFKEACRYTSLFAGFAVALHFDWYLTAACFLGLFWHQIMFTAHDAGHLAITHNYVIDTLIGLFVADFCCGLSLGWWKSSHNVHHLVPNHPEHDPDIQNVPLFATSSTSISPTFSTYYQRTLEWDAFAEVAIQVQKFTYYPVMCVARFKLYALSWEYLLSSKAVRIGSVYWVRPTEVLFMAIYWYLFGYCLVWCTLPTWPIRVAFVLLSHMITMPLHVQITLSHWGMSTADLGPSESFAQKQLRTTMDVDCPAWLDWIHGGLQFQAVHHLFPRVPRHNLRKVQTLIRGFSAETGIKYTTYGFVDGNKVVLSRLNEVAKQLDVLAKCSVHMMNHGDGHGH